MKHILLLVTIISISGCSLIPSKFDLNEAKAITDIQLTARTFDCKKPVEQVEVLSNEIVWLQTYSKFRGSRDVVAVVEGIAITTQELKDRLEKGSISPMYCDLKKKILIQQADITAKAVQGRF